MEAQKLMRELLRLVLLRADPTDRGLNDLQGALGLMSKIERVAPSHMRESLWGIRGTVLMWHGYGELALECFLNQNRAGKLPEAHPSTENVYRMSNPQTSSS